MLKTTKQAGQLKGEPDRRSHLRPAKNFLGVLGRATRRLGIRREEGLIARVMGKRQDSKNHLDNVKPTPQK